MKCKRLYKMQKKAGALFENDIAVTFGNDDAAVKALNENVGLIDLSHW